MNYVDVIGIIFIFLVLTFSNKHARLCFGILVLTLLGLYSLPFTESFSQTSPSSQGQTTILLCALLLIVLFLKRVI